jgi:hypothetical protein
MPVAGECCECRTWRKRKQAIPRASASDGWTHNPLTYPVESGSGQLPLACPGQVDRDSPRIGDRTVVGGQAYPTLPGPTERFLRDVLCLVEASRRAIGHGHNAGEVRSFRGDLVRMVRDMPK